MATYYARNVTGNWASNTSWDSASSGGAGPAGPPIAGDVAIFDSGFTGNITVAATAACQDLTVQAGATGTLTYGAGQVLTTSRHLTLVSGFNLAGTGRHNQSGNGTWTTAGLTLPWVRINASLILTLADDLNVTLLDLAAQATFAGAFDITCATLLSPFAGSWSHTLVAGQTLTVTTEIRLVAPYAHSSYGGYNREIKSSSPSTSTSLVYQGTAANCCVCGIVFTDVAFSGSPVTDLANWYGGTLTRTTGITNRTSADIGGGSSRALMVGGLL